ncbi:shikimate kinase [Candidatus Nitrosoglobus terrae]|uniref:Shikimate kinase n=1 Tax=Candidatus Nitrosoglobus terrae TaxID=1630141 RepID=A0A1Q2SPP2_9GAMM|nr:shikimate kinase [Candidatus Nitrosoglobus terrae]BAW81135.1 shikimate kinase [Candidatus Nitrosoglobus terrae]
MIENVFLIGPMGVGKTTVGRYLARLLGRKFYDSDREIVYRTGVSIPVIFEVEGEVGFRQRERGMIAELTQLNSIILATGGGAVLAAENRQYLTQRGIVVYLYASAEQLHRRTMHDHNRPLLQTKNPLEYLKSLLKARDPLYREVADIMIKTGERPIRVVVNEVLQQLKLCKKGAYQKKMSCNGLKK